MQLEFLKWIPFFAYSPTETRVSCAFILSDLASFAFRLLGKEMATHSSVLAWRIPGTGEPGGLPSMGSHRVGNDWSDLAAAFRLRQPASLPVEQRTWNSGGST